MSSAANPSDPSYPPDGYVTPDWPSLYWPPITDDKVLYRLYDIWRFTLLWTFVLFALFHGAAVVLALSVQIGKKKTSWRFLWVIPLVYALIAGVEALVAGSVTGALGGAIYNAGGWYMPTWVPFLWGCVNVLVLVVSSFSISGGL